MWCSSSILCLWSRLEYLRWRLHHLGMSSQLKEKAIRLHPSPVTPQIHSEDWPPHRELIPTLRAPWLQAIINTTCLMTRNQEHRTFGFDVWPPPSFLRNAVTAGGDHSQSRTDGEPAVWAVCQQSLAVPQPEPRPGCTGDIYTVVEILYQIKVLTPCWKTQFFQFLLIILLILNVLNWNHYIRHLLSSVCTVWYFYIIFKKFLIRFDFDVLFSEESSNYSFKKYNNCIWNGVEQK